MSHIKINVTSLTEEDKHAADLNKKGRWSLSSSNWVFNHNGSFKQACYLAIKEYRRSFSTKFGILYVIRYEKPKSSKQKELF